LFNDMFVLTKIKKYTKIKKGTTQLTKSEHYVVHKQPVPLDSLPLKFAFVIIHLTRYYQELWIEKFQESIENYESIQLKDMLKCTPLYSSLSLRRCSSSRLMQCNVCNDTSIPQAINSNTHYHAQYSQLRNEP
uniref:PH domain-containing protein n=1 Tax=Gongylonema pulchrum TaxID=637853 RepID=A0A183EKD6_9BILA